MTDDRTLLTDWADTLVQGLARAGVTQFVLCPGARSMPLTLAVIRSGEFQITECCDERVAGFLALGLSRATGRPCALVCTSGSAGAHMYPAVIEAEASHVPLVVITADRPHELHGCGAAQTTDQLRLFGTHVRSSVDLGTPTGHTAAFRALRRSAAQAVFTSTYPVPGPVHLNFRARKPLEPPYGLSPEEQRRSREGLKLAWQTVVHLPTVEPSSLALDEATAMVRSSVRGMIVCGAIAPGNEISQQVRRLAALTGFPILAEASSQLRRGDLAGAETVDTCDAFDRIIQCRGFMRDWRPDLVILLGTGSCSMTWDAFVGANPRLVMLALAEQGWPDPNSQAAMLVVGPLQRVLEGISTRLARAGHEIAPDTRAAATKVRRANEIAWSVVSRQIEAHPTFTEGMAVKVVAAALPKGSALFVGNSLSIRMLDGFVRELPARVAVFSQRGVNGIDGNVAHAIGIAMGSAKPMTVVLGDVAFLHDIGALACAKWKPDQPGFVVVVLNNRGGRIFELLPGYAKASPREQAAMTSPLALDFAGVGMTFGAEFRRASGADVLDLELRDAHRRGGVTIIEVDVGTSGAAAQSSQIAAAVSSALEAELVPNSN